MNKRDPQIHVRCPPDIKKWLEDQAQENRRTLNAQIVYCMEQHMLRSTAGQSCESAVGNPARS
jgi:hypothetical protein